MKTKTINKKNTLGWQVKKEKKLFKAPIMTLMEQESISPEGEKGKYITITTADWVVVVPKVLENNKEFFLMVEQWRHGSKEISIEFPGGVIDKDETPETAAKRELLEETGYKAETLTYLTSLNPNPALFSNTIHFYSAENLKNTQEQHLDNDEYINIKKIPIEEVFSSMGKKPYSHGLMSAALFSYKQHIDF